MELKALYGMIYIVCVDYVLYVEKGGLCIDMG